MLLLHLSYMLIGLIFSSPDQRSCELLLPLSVRPTRRVWAILQSPCPLVVRPSVQTFVADFSAGTWRNDFIFGIWLWHSDLYRVSPFHVYRTSTSCLPLDLEFFMFTVMKKLSLQISQLLLEEMISYLVYGFGIVTCTVSPLSRFTAHLLPVYRLT